MAGGSADAWSAVSAMAEPGDAGEALRRVGEMRTRSDSSIVVNVVFCAAVSGLLLGLYLVLWRAQRDFYAPNTRYARRRKKADSEPEDASEAALVAELQAMDDAQLLAWVGLDAFVFLQTLRLLGAIMAMLALPALVLLVPVYVLCKSSPDALRYGHNTNADGTTRFFLLATVHSVVPRALWATLAYNAYALCVVLYGIYVFYRSLAAYRQAYMRNPSACLAQVALRRLALGVGGVARARRLLDMAGRAVVLTNVSSSYGPAGIISYLASAGLRDVCALVVVRHRPALQTLLQRRNVALEDVERQLAVLHARLAAAVAARRGTDVKTLLASLGSEERPSADRRAAVLAQAMDPDFAAGLRPKLQGGGDALAHAYRRMMAYDARLDAAVAASARGDEYAAAGPGGAPVSLLGESEVPREIVAGSVPESCNSIKGGADHVDCRTIVAVRRYADVRGNASDLRLLVFGSSVPAIVVFGSRRSAAVAQQVLLSSRPFSMQAFSAPLSAEIIWENLYLPALERTVRWLVGSVAYVLLNLMFTLVSSAMVILMSTSAAATVTDAIARATAAYPQAHTALAGIVTPLVLNVLVSLAPAVLALLARYEGCWSHTAVQTAVLGMYTWMLFAQTFVSNIVDIASQAALAKLMEGNIGSLTAKLGASLPQQSVFFFNLIVQRATISLMFALLEPGKLLLRLVASGVGRRDYRRVAAEASPRAISLGVAYPESVLFIFMTTLALAPISPVILTVGVLYAVVALWVYRRRFVFAAEPLHEGGGLYWTHVPTPILVGVLSGQVFSLLQFSFSSATVPAVLIVMLGIATVGAIVFVRRVFGRLALQAPLGPEGLAASSALADSMLEMQVETLRRVSAVAGDDPEVLEEGLAGGGLGAPSGGGMRHASELDLVLPAGTTVGESRYDTVAYDFAGVPADDGAPGDVSGTTTALGEGGSPEGQAQEQQKGAETQPEVLVPTDNPYCNPVLFERHLTVHVPPTLVSLVRAYSELGAAQ